MNKLALIGGGAVVVLAGAYFGLSAYSSKEAEKRLEDWTYEVELDDKLTWKSVSASPFGGSVTISDLEFEGSGDEPALRVAKVLVSDLVDSDDRSSIRLQFKGIEADNGALSSLRDLGALAGGEIDRDFARAAHNFEPAMLSGLTELKPFDVTLFVDVDDDDGIFESEMSVMLPQMFEVSVNYRLENQRGMKRQLSRLDRLTESDNPRQWLASLEGIAESLSRAEIGHASISYKDHGFIERSIALHQRYNTQLDPAAGNPDKQRLEQYERMVNTGVKNCERDGIVKVLDNACELMGEMLLGEINGIELTAKPKDKVRIQDLGRLEGRAAARVLDRLNLSLDSH